MLFCIQKVDLFRLFWSFSNNFDINLIFFDRFRTIFVADLINFTATIISPKLSDESNSSRQNYVDLRELENCRGMPCSEDIVFNFYSTLDVHTGCASENGTQFWDGISTWKKRLFGHFLVSLESLSTFRITLSFFPHITKWLSFEMITEATQIFSVHFFA